MKLATSAIDGFLKNPPKTCRIILLYGPDEGMNRMRAKNLIRQKLGDNPDPFALVELQAGELSDDPARLLDEIQTLPMGGKQKLVYIRQAGDGLSNALIPCIDICPNFTLIILEAGELGPKSSLRQMIEDIPETAAAIPAYDDEGRGLEQFVSASFHEAGVSMDSETRRLLLSLLSANRMVNKQEIDKLLLYIGDQKSIGSDDVEACLVSQANIGLDDVIYAAFSGQPKLIGAGLNKLQSEGVFAVTILRAAARHAIRLHLVKTMAAMGANMEDTVRGLRPPVFFKKIDAFKRQLRIWNPPSLLRATERLMEAEIQSKSTGYPGDDITGQTLLAIAVQAEQLQRRAA